MSKKSHMLPIQNMARTNAKSDKSWLEYPAKNINQLRSLCPLAPLL